MKTCVLAIASSVLLLAGAAHMSVDAQTTYARGQDVSPTYDGWEQNSDGTYTLRIQDLQYKGGPDFAYRIRAGEIPYVDAIFPLGGQRGHEVAVELKGRNLAGMRKMSMSLDPSDPTPACST